MRQITIDFGIQTYPLFAGYVGEHNATELIAIKPADMSGAMFSLAFMTNGEVIHSKFFTADEEIKTALWQQLTIDNDLYVQLEAYDENGDYLAKTSMVKLMLSNSVHGNDVIADADNPDVYAEISQNTLLRERLEDNVDTLDKLTTSDDGNLLFNGEEIKGGGGGVTDHEKLENRDKENQHPISAITNLQRVLDNKRPVDELVPASQVKYTNDNLADQSGTVKATLDESIGFVVGTVAPTLETLGLAVNELTTKSHTHTNKTVLDELNDSNGSLTYKGKEIGSGGGGGIVERPTDSHFFYKGEFEGYLFGGSRQSLALLSWESNEKIPEGTEIKTVKFYFDGTVVDIRELNTVDNITYVLNMHKAYTDVNDTGGMVYAVIGMVVEWNTIATALQSDGIERVEIIYYTDGGNA